MATIIEIQYAMKILIAANLRNAPERITLPDTIELWTKKLQDVPGIALVQAAEDIVISEEFWPSLKKIRDYAYKVQSKNNTSSAPNHWRSESNTVRTFDWIAKVGPDGHYYAFQIDTGKAPEPGVPLFPPDIQEELDSIENQTGGILNEEHRELIHEKTMPYLVKAGRAMIGARSFCSTKRTNYGLGNS